ncbi:MAG: hypothetical protein KF749_11710 [Bacteroidetes bacterium]|nr:hypothetical protein [Bacteroidota bacterium]MCW5894529.1 hypothetical protein [Bacteroidota bacterium]
MRQEQNSRRSVVRLARADKAGTSYGKQRFFDVSSRELINLVGEYHAKRIRRGQLYSLTLRYTGSWPNSFNDEGPSA